MVSDDEFGLNDNDLDAKTTDDKVHNTATFRQHLDAVKELTQVTVS